MSSLIYSHNGDHCTGKCDANCYDAKHPECNCICGGMNHGVGQQKAIDNTKEWAEKWIEKWKLDHPDDIVNIDPDKILQGKLF